MLKRIFKVKTLCIQSNGKKGRKGIKGRKGRKGSGGNNSPRAPLVLSASYQRSGAPGDVRSPADGRKQAEFTSAVKRGGRRASQEPVKRVRSRRESVALGRQERRERQERRKGGKAAGEIIPPAPPCFALRLRRAAGVVQGTKSRASRTRERQGSGAKAGGLGGRCFGGKVSAGVCGCTRLRWPTDVPATREHRC